MSFIVSIICPIRNEEQYIADCLQALIEQTFSLSNMEILVVDGMSDDRTREIVLGFAQKHTNISLIENPERIVPYGLNYGVKHAQGKYILRMDGHAKPAPNYVEMCVAALERNGTDCVGGPIITIEETDTGKAVSAAMSSRFGVGNSRFRTSIKEACLVDTLAFPAYRREVFEKYGMFDTELIRCQDDEFNFRIRKLGGKILLTPEIKSWYYPRSGFSKLWRQYFGYGFFKVRVFQKNTWMMQARHFAPLSLVSILLLALCLMPVIPEAIVVFCTIFALHATAAVFAAMTISRRNREVSIWKLLLSFYILHYSYGLGFFWGLIRFAPRWFHREQPA